MDFRDSDDYISADVLVIGGGVGGCFAAIKAAEEGAKVIVFEKANILRSGGNSTGISRMPLIHPDYNYSYEEFARLTVETGGGIVDEDISCEFARDTLDRILELESYGIKVRSDDGSFIFMQGPDLSPGKPAIWAPGPSVWHDLKPTLAKKVMSYPNVTVLNRTTCIGLLTEDGVTGARVIGAVGLGTRTGKFVISRAKAVVLITGDSERLGRHSDTLYAPTRFITASPPTNCGEGLAMAYRAGADVIDMEFAYLATIWKDFSHAGIGVSAGLGRTIAGTGAELTSADRYRRTHRGVFNTEGPLYADASIIDGWPEEKGMMQRLLWVMENGPTSPGYFLWMKERDEDLKKAPIEIEWRPPAVHNNQAGIRIDVDARSSLEGLYCAGDVAGGGWRQSAGGAFVFGARAGRNAAVYARKAAETKLNSEQVEAQKNRILEALTINPRDGYSWIELEDKARRIASDYGPPFTNDAKLERGLVRLERIKTRYLPRLYARNPREMMRVPEVEGVFLVVEAFLRASLFRKESRQNPCSLFYKTEYPERDDKNWLKHTLIQNVDGEMKLSKKDVQRLRKK